MHNQGAHHDPVQEPSIPEPRTPQTGASRWCRACVGAICAFDRRASSRCLLIEPRSDNFGNHLIYDTELNVTWYQPHNSELSWADAHSYVQACLWSSMAESSMIGDYRARQIRVPVSSTAAAVAMWVGR